MQVLLRFSRLVDWLNGRIGQAVKWLVLIIALISTGNALSRRLFDLSSNGWLELQWYLFAGIFMLAAGDTLLRNAHVRIDVLNARLSPRAQNWIDVFGLVFFLLPMCGLILWLSLPIVQLSIASGEYSPNPGGLIRWPVKVLLPIGLSLLALQAVSELIKRVAFLTGHGENPLEKAQASETISKAGGVRQQHQQEGRRDA